MSFRNHILRVSLMIRPRELIRTSKISSSFSSSTTPNPTYTDPVVFFFLDTPFPLFWMVVFNTRSSKSWNAFIKAWSSHFLFQAEVLEVLVFFEEIGGLDLYIRSGPSCIRVFNIWKKWWSSYFSFCASFLAFLSLFLFSACYLLSSTSFKLKTQAPWLLYWIPVCYAYRFCYVLAAKNSVLVWFRIILSAIASLAALKVLYKRVS